MPETPTRVGDLIKAKEVNREDVEAAIATVFDAPRRAEVPRIAAYRFR